MARLKDAYVKDVAPALMKKFSYKSVMQIPKLDKVVINVGCGEARDNPKIMDAILSDLAKITGQKAVAVSYTHLDVYKRQGLWLCTGARCRGLCVCTQRRRHAGAAPDGGDAHLILCLLYTSRCV